ncbi:hypothetical protein BLAT2472_90165 [Burkholderia latens]
MDPQLSERLRRQLRPTHVKGAMLPQPFDGRRL